MPKSTAPTYEAYCMRCSENVEIQDPKKKTMKNGRKMAQGTCPECGTKVQRILGKDD